MTSRATSPPRSTDADLHARSRLAAWLADTLGEPGPPAALELGPATEANLGAPARRVERLLEWATAENVENWEAERVRLMVNAPGGIALPLEASWWIDGVIGGPTTAQVAAFQRDEGLVASRAAGQADALPALLELAHVLLQHQRAAGMTGQPELAKRSRERERELLERFLLPWIPRACEAGRAATQSAWWSAVLSLLEALVVAEWDRLSPSSPERALP